MWLNFWRSGIKSYQFIHSFILTSDWGWFHLSGLVIQFPGSCVCSFNVCIPSYTLCVLYSPAIIYHSPICALRTFIYVLKYRGRWSEDMRMARQDNLKFVRLKAFYFLYYGGEYLSSYDNRLAASYHNYQPLQCSPTTVLWFNEFNQKLKRVAVVS